MGNHPFIILLFVLGFVCALYKIFESKLSRSTDTQKGYVMMVVIIITIIGLYIFVNRYIGCGYMSRSGRMNK